MVVGFLFLNFLHNLKYHKELQNNIQSRQKLESQQQENKAVQKVHSPRPNYLTKG